MKPGTYHVSVRHTGFRRNDAYTAYLDMGRPATLTAAQLAQLQALTADRPTTSTLRVRADGKAALDLPMRDHDVVMVELTPG